MMKLKKEIDIVPVTEIESEMEGTECNFIDLLSQAVTTQKNRDPTKFSNNKIQVKLSLDGGVAEQQIFASCLSQ